MPLYEYQCEHCGKRFEVIQKFSDEPLTTHAECGSGPVERLLSAPALQFKGSGWYVTDYARAGNKSDSAKSETKTESKSDSNGSASTPAASESKSSSSPSTTKSSNTKSE